MSAVAITTLVAAQATHVIPYVHSLTPVGDGQVEIVYSPVVNEKVQSRKRETKLVSIDNILCYRLDEKPAKSFVTLISDSYVVNTNKDGYEIDENGFIVMCGTCYSPKHYIPTVTAPVGSAAGDDAGEDAGEDAGDDAGAAAAEAPAEKPAARGRGRTAAATAKAATSEDKPATASRRGKTAAAKDDAAEAQAEKPAGRSRRAAAAATAEVAAEAPAEKPAGRTRTRAAAAETPAEKPATTRGRRSAGWTTRGE